MCGGAALRGAFGRFEAFVATPTVGGSAAGCAVVGSAVVVLAGAAGAFAVGACVGAGAWACVVVGGCAAGAAGSAPAKRTPYTASAHSMTAAPNAVPAPNQEYLLVVAARTLIDGES